MSFNVQDKENIDPTTGRRSPRILQQRFRLPLQDITDLVLENQLRGHVRHWYFLLLIFWFFFFDEENEPVKFWIVTTCFFVCVYSDHDPKLQSFEFELSIHKCSRSNEKWSFFTWQKTACSIASLTQSFDFELSYLKLSINFCTVVLTTDFSLPNYLFLKFLVE